MSKVTSKLQVTLPKALAGRYGIHPGDEITFREAGDAIRVEVAGEGLAPRLRLEERLELFDAATERQRERDARWRGRRPPKSRGWTREDLYTRGLPR
jgi:AbrB family looped-hinge helix DNA binding protein